MKAMSDARDNPRHTGCFIHQLLLCRLLAPLKTTCMDAEVENNLDTKKPPCRALEYLP